MIKKGYICLVSYIVAQLVVYLPSCMSAVSTQEDVINYRHHHKSKRGNKNKNTMILVLGSPSHDLQTSREIGALNALHAYPGAMLTFSGGNTRTHAQTEAGIMLHDTKRLFVHHQRTLL